jgi:PadR family transcriptional regulator, regulatory protein PadR
MPPKERSDHRGDMLRGTLDLLVLRTLIPGPAHGHTIAHVIEKASDDVLQVEHGSLYPALHRLEHQGWIVAEFKDSNLGRPAKVYALTRAGRKQLERELQSWRRLSSAVELLIETA